MRIYGFAGCIARIYIERPCRVQLMESTQVSSRGHKALLIFPGHHGIANRYNFRLRSHDVPDPLYLIWSKAAAARSNNDVCAKAAEFAAERAFQIGINGQRHGGHGGDDGDGEEGSEGPVFAHP